MHVVFRESHGLEETAAPYDPGQTPADMVVLSFSDSDLGAFAAGWRGMDGPRPSLRLQNLVALRHPVSVDSYLDNTLSGARAILIRLLGGESYWAYGLASVQDLARRRGIALAVLPVDGREDPALAAASTVAPALLSRLTALCDMGGAAAAGAALAELGRAAGLALPASGPVGELPACGWWSPEAGVTARPEGPGPWAVVVFYRSYLAAADTDPVAAMIDALRARGFRAAGLFAPSLKGDAAAWVERELRALFPAAIVNATAFSARERGVSPLDAPGCPVHQLALSTARRRDWEGAARGLSPADLAMHVVLPEVDGRILAGVVSFKQPTRRDEALQYSRFIHRADPQLVDAAADRVAAWHRLGTVPVARRKLALVLSTYPGRPDQIAHAVGLDALASADAMLRLLGDHGWTCAPGAALAPSLRETIRWPLSEYLRALALLPQRLRDDLAAAWGAPEADPAVAGGAFHFAAVRRGNALVALQPERGQPQLREDDYHDLTRTPRHHYVAFYLWLRSQGLQALVHVGAHGTLEWLPGKAVALGPDCWPQALLGELPVIYPFIVNDPGEAAQAKRRLGAVTLGHVPPPLLQAALPEALAGLERLLDEYATADGLDPSRRTRLIAAIRQAAQAAGVEDDLAIPVGASAAEAIPRIDRFVCDLKESRFGDGLHVYGAAAGEAEGLLAALDGRRVEPGPSGSPARGRGDVLPTGRNLFAVDPRAVPTRAAHAQGVKLAEELLRAHLQDHGDWPRGLVVDLWGSASMRTAGEEFAMALHLAGLAPVWDGATGRATGVEVVPLALLGRPRIDVTLRVSGLFRDIFPGLAGLFELGAEALAAREETAADNPYLSRAPRVFGPRPGSYGLGMGDLSADLSDAGRQAAGLAWLAGSEWVVDGAEGRRDRAALESRLAGADAVVHVQDLAETDLLMAPDFAAHQGGVLAARAALGLPEAAAWHLDSSRVEAPRARPLGAEIARVVRARAANPDWAAGMMRHGFRGGAEIAATLDNLAAFAQLTRSVPGHLFDLYHEATLGRDEVVAFLDAENPQALAMLRARFDALRAAGLWRGLRNSTGGERL
ncbi:cobaltochelatase CobN subunit [Paracoccus solventivorans]|uniref:Cobaltochelatase CobN subunit n=1 Tax=Paracoccus solventivorans TaxID=53463 RepID=A0A1M7GZI7_9RHOB|nr:cobaltochelatase subunit CobN [Paracoccus solventivorans]SHM21802.1 cobaltochelatase CobN subunit [Paracoccus solventivorans]